MQDEFEGQGGSYIVDKKGRRQLVERTQDAPVSPADPAPVPAAQAEQPEGKE